MLSFSKVRVQNVSLTSVEVEWEYKTDLSLVAFRIQRSESPDSGFLDLPGQVLSSAASIYLDHSPAQKHEFRVWYYRIQAYQSSNGALAATSDPARYESPRDLVALEIIRRQNLYLRRFVGVPVFLMISRTYGTRCTTCWDPIKRRQNRDDCPTCYNTTFEGGFFDPIPGFFARDPDEKSINVVEFGDIENNEAVAWTGPFPVLKARDIIISSIDRWRIVTTRSIHHKDSLVMQVLKLTKINRNDIEYKLEMPSFDAFTEIDLIQRIFGGSSGDITHRVTEKGQISLAGWDPSTLPGFVKSTLEDQDLTLGS